jgi:hypothetical protein
MASHFLQAKNGFSFSLGKKFSRWRSILRPLGHGGHTSFVVSRGLVAFRFFSLAASPVWPVLWILQRMCPQTARRKKSVCCAGNRAEQNKPKTGSCGLWARPQKNPKVASFFTKRKELRP